LEDGREVDSFQLPLIRRNIPCTGYPKPGQICTEQQACRYRRFAKFLFHSYLTGLRRVARS